MQEEIKSPPESLQIQVQSAGVWLTTGDEGESQAYGFDVVVGEGEICVV